MTRFDSYLADLVAALFTWVLLLAAAVLVVYGAYRFGWWRRGTVEELERKRARVLAAMEQAAAETVSLPQQRSGGES